MENMNTTQGQHNPSIILSIEERSPPAFDEPSSREIVFTGIPFQIHRIGAIRPACWFGGSDRGIPTPAVIRRIKVGTVKLGLEQPFVHLIVKEA